jgi:hypothetical protein
MDHARCALVGFVLVLAYGLVVAQETADVQMIGAEGDGAKFWPSWRGPSAQGLVSGTGYPDAWSSTEAVLWKKPVPKAATVADCGATEFSDDGLRRRPADVSAGVRPLRRLEVVGNVSTFRSVDRNTHFKNGFASSTPATDGRFVYVSFGIRGLAGFDFTGKLVWHQDIGSPEAYHGAAGSLLLYKNRLILFQDGIRQAFIAAFDARDGKQMWLTDRGAYAGWGTPVAVRVGTHDEIIASSMGNVTAHNLMGRELWRGATRSRSFRRPWSGGRCLSIRPRRSHICHPARRHRRRHPHARRVGQPARLALFHLRSYGD